MSRGGGGGGDAIPNKSLYIKNLSEEISKYGKIADVYIPVDYYTRKGRGFAYVQFESLRDAKDAVRDLNPLVLHGRELTVEFAQGDRKTPSEMRYKERRSIHDRNDGSRRNGYRQSSRRSKERYSRRSRSKSRDRDRERERDRDRSRDRERRYSRSPVRGHSRRSRSVSRSRSRRHGSASRHWRD